MALVSKSTEYFSGFDPRMIPGCILWLDGTDSATITGTTQVTQWTDKSSNAYAFTRKSTGFPNVSNMPFSDLNGLFIGSNAALANSNIPIPTDYTFFAVANRPGSNGGYGYIAKMNTAADFFGFVGVHNEQNSFATFVGTNTLWRDIASNVPKKCITELPTLIGCVLSGATLTPYWNGEPMTDKTGTATATTGMTIGDAATTTFGQPWLGIIGEVLMFSNALSSNHRQQIEGYLTWKWKLRREDPYTNWATGSSPLTFNPTSVSGIALWLDASDTSTLTLSGSNVTGWTDKSGLGRVVTFRGATGLSNPIYDRLSRSVVTSNNSFTAANVDTRKSTTIHLNVFIVYRWLQGGSNAQTSNVCLWGADGGGGNNRFQLLGFPGGLPRMYGLSRSGTGVLSVFATGLESTNQIVYSCRYASNISTGGGMFVRVNGQKATEGTYTEGASSPQTAQTSIAFGATDEANSFPGRIAFNEILVYRADITDSNRLDIETYLATKWGIRWYSPTIPTHPFYAEPISNRPFGPLDAGFPDYWFDPADRLVVTSTGTTLTSISNKGTIFGSNLTVSTGTPTIGAVTQNGLNMIRMPASSSLQYSATLTTLPRSRFYAMRPLVNTGAAVALIMLYQNLANASGNEVDLFNGGQITKNANAVTNILLANVANQSNVFGIWTIRNSATAASNRVASNGNPVSFITSLAAQSYNTAASIFYMNRREAGQTYTGTYDLGEFISYTLDLSTSEVFQVEGYLAWKWATQGSLPSTHPFRTFYPLTAPFTPGQASNLALWLDAEDSNTFELSGSLIRRWRDKSGSGLYSFSASQYDASAVGVCTLSNDVFGKMPAVRFTGSNAFVGNISCTTTGLTAFAVASRDNAGGDGVERRLVTLSVPGLQDHDNAGRAAALYLRNAGTNQLSTFRNNVQGSIVSPTPVNQPFLAGCLYNGSTGAVYLDGSLGSTPVASTGTFASTVYGIGAQGGTVQEYHLGFIGEVLIFSNALTTWERQRVEGYLAWKWGTQSRLGDWHPYKYISP
jgi:hypothetical protein